MDGFAMSENSNSNFYIDIHKIYAVCVVYVPHIACPCQNINYCVLLQRDIVTQSIQKPNDYADNKNVYSEPL